MAEHYLFRIEGVLSDDLVDSFGPVDHEVVDGDTVFSCLVTDPAELFGLLSRFDTLGLQLLGLTRLDRPVEKPADGFC